MELGMELWLVMVGYGWVRVGVRDGVRDGVMVGVSYFIIHRFVIHVERYTCWTVTHVGAPVIVV